MDPNAQPTQKNAIQQWNERLGFNGVFKNIYDEDPAAFNGTLEEIKKLKIPKGSRENLLVAVSWADDRLDTNDDTQLQRALERVKQINETIENLPEEE
jgi:hypothetical protein